MDGYALVEREGEDLGKGGAAQAQQAGREEGGHRHLMGPHGLKLRWGRCVCSSSWCVGCGAQVRDTTRVKGTRHKLNSSPAASVLENRKSVRSPGSGLNRCVPLLDLDGWALRLWDRPARHMALMWASSAAQSVVVKRQRHSHTSCESVGYIWYFLGVDYSRFRGG